MPLLSDDDIEAGLGQLEGWQRWGNEIQKVYSFPSYKGVLAFVARVGALAEEQDHHPELLVQYGMVTVRLTSHDMKGLTERDFRLAKAIDA
jgi:4a-hydroxytetrahydrobiopterin dehydratase